jgi:hypothetical protein
MGSALAMVVALTLTTTPEKSMSLVSEDEYRTLSETDDNSYIDLPSQVPIEKLCIGTVCRPERDKR